MKNMAIMKRILIGLAVVFLMMILIGVLAEAMFNKLEENALDLSNVHAPMVDACMEIKLEVTTAHLIAEEVMTGGEDKSAIDEAYEMLDNAAWYTDAIINGGTNDEGTFVATTDSMLSEDAKALSTLILDFKTATEGRYDATFGSRKSATELSALEDSFDKSFEKLIGVADDMEEAVKGNMDISKNELRSTAKSASWQIILTTFFAMVISIVVATLILIKINKSLVDIAKNLFESSNLVASASEQLASSGQQLSAGSAEQAASIEETSATLDETASMVAQNTDNTKRANVQSKDASESATAGSDKMKDMIESMDDIKKSSVEISKIIKVIDDIAFQTNMLALNAAVEAARAGDAGLGFAVVAEEVRNLAGKSAQAAKDTAEIIDANIQSSEQGVLISEEVNVSLEEILTKTDDVNKLIGEITVASEEQAKGISQVNTAIGQMENVVQQNAGAAEESAASAEELNSQAVILENIVHELDILIRGEKKANANRNSSVQTDDFKTTYDESEALVKESVLPNDIINLDDEEDF